MDYRIWHETQLMIQGNAEIHRPSEFYRWLRDIFVSGMAMAIRRLTDTDKYVDGRDFSVRLEGHLSGTMERWSRVSGD